MRPAVHRLAAEVRLALEPAVDLGEHVGLEADTYESAFARRRATSRFYVITA